MSDRVAVITGGARGIGRAIALDLGGQGWSVALCYRTSSQEGSQVVEALRRKGSQAEAFQCDVSDPKAAEKFVKQVEERWGRS